MTGTPASGVATGPGRSRGLVFWTPHCPKSFLPNVSRPASEVATQEWYCPQESERTPRPDTASTSVGVSESVVVPVPSWP